jgi:hypothetical protein
LIPTELSATEARTLAHYKTVLLEEIVRDPHLNPDLKDRVIVAAMNRLNHLAITRELYRGDLIPIMVSFRQEGRRHKKIWLLAPVTMQAAPPSGSPR